MEDSESSEPRDDAGSPPHRRWNWGAGVGLAIGVGIAFGMVFVPSMGIFGIAIGIALGAGLAPTFAMSMARPGDTAGDQREHD
ncbi:hypothetical protein [Promicromonospora sp. NPDC050249]|uniref:hypothetical protein n=1 Tax=Promicromonospora sp. NPDC050249 TaxID=3154743 RepID=UPI0033F92E43